MGADHTLGDQEGQSQLNLPSLAWGRVIMFLSVRLVFQPPCPLSLPPPDNYCTSLNSNSPLKICRWRIEFFTYSVLTIAVEKTVEFFVFHFPVLLFCQFCR